jgi:hypothetical protein
MPCLRIGRSTRPQLAAMPCARKAAWMRGLP